MRSLAVLLIVLTALAGCSGSKPKHQATPTTTSTTPSAASTTAVQPSTTQAGPPGCTTAALNISLGQGNGAAGTIATPIVFRNTSGARCVMGGYPGVAGLDANGNQLAQADRTPRGIVPGLPPGNDTPPVVTLNPGAAASATVESSDVPTGNAASCPTFDGLLVTPPNETHSVRLKLNLTVCARFQVHPIQPGA